MFERSEAHEYVVKAPAEVITPVRKRFQQLMGRAHPLTPPTISILIACNKCTGKCRGKEDGLSAGLSAIASVHSHFFRLKGPPPTIVDTVPGV